MPIRCLIGRIPRVSTFRSLAAAVTVACRLLVHGSLLFLDTIHQCVPSEDNTRLGTLQTIVYAGS
jgi:hypothetical protein